MNACTHMVSVDLSVMDGLLPLAYVTVFCLITAKALYDRNLKSRTTLTPSLIPAGFTPKEAVSWT